MKTLVFFGRLLYAACMVVAGTIAGLLSILIGIPIILWNALMFFLDSNYQKS
jgi:hypothetical protein